MIKLLFTVFLFLIFSESQSQSLANTARKKDSTNKVAAPTGPKKIITLEEVPIPEAMRERIRAFKYSEIEAMTEEYQENVKKKLKDDDEEEEYILLVKMKFLYDHIIGFTKYISRTDPKVSKDKIIIDIPVEWCGQMDSTKESICVETIDDIYRFKRDSIKTSNWVQKVEKALISNVKQGEAFGKPVTTKGKGKKGTAKEDATPTNSGDKKAATEKKAEAEKTFKKDKSKAKKPTGFGVED